MQDFHLNISHLQDDPRIMLPFGRETGKGRHIGLLLLLCLCCILLVLLIQPRP